MKKKVKTWSAIGVAMLAGATVAEAGALKPLHNIAPSVLVLVDGEGGEGGGGEAPTSYALQSTDAAAFVYDGKSQVEAYASLVHQTYAEAVAEAETLAAAIDAFLASPAEDTLFTARNAWVAARPAYLRSETFRFYDGPIEAIEGEINAWPMNEAAIDYVEGKAGAGIINSKDVIDAAAITALNQKADEADVTTGWHAVEFLLWGQDMSLDGPGHRPHTDYISGQGNNDRRRDYLKEITMKLVADLGAMEAAWATEKTDNYRATFVRLDQREALGRIINGMAILAGFEFMSERLGVALDSGDQEDEHSCFSDTTKQDFVHDLEGIKRVWYGAGIGQLVAAKNEALAKSVSGLFLDAEVRVGKLGDPFDRVLASAKDSPERKTAEAVVTAMQALAEGLKKSGTALGVQVLIPSG